MTSHKLSALKSAIWRVMGVFIYAAIFFLYTGLWHITLASTLVHHTTFLFVFYLHERFYLKMGKPNSRLKAWTYEVLLGMGLGGLIVFFFTGSWKAVSLISGTYTVVKLITYHINEKVWRKFE